MRKWIWRALWLLLPAAWLARSSPALEFVLACLALLPLARTMGDATEELAARLGPAAGSLLNATFGNAAELILGIAALAHGHVALVKGSLVGSILGNLLLVAGCSIVAGGLRLKRLQFNKLAASSSVVTLFLAVVAMAVPTVLQPPRQQLSTAISGVLIVMYALSLLFQLRTHASQLGSAHEAHETRGTVAKHLGRLFLAAAAVSVASELLVSSLEGALSVLHLPEMFVGVVVVAIVGNAAEHATAVVFGRRGEMNIALGISWESSKQIALFVAPVLVFAGMAMGTPMNLSFGGFEVMALGASVLALSLIALDGETHWLEGAFLLATWVVLALGFYFLG